jgi:hypothetical protein
MATYTRYGLQLARLPQAVPPKDAGKKTSKKKGIFMGSHFLHYTAMEKQSFMDLFSDIPLHIPIHIAARQTMQNP